jgi:hypothetical protein
MTPADRRPSRATQLARGLAAALVLAGLLVGPPAALLRWGAWPITGAPRWDQLRELPTTLVSDSALLAALTVALWARGRCSPPASWSKPPPRSAATPPDASYPPGPSRDSPAPWSRLSP